MATLPSIDTLVSKVDAAHEAAHAGDWKSRQWNLAVSQLADPCERKLWLRLRRAGFESHDGRLLRLFRRGSLEEKSAAEDLRAAGCNLRYTGEEQLEVRCGHLRGFLDGVILSGDPDAPKAVEVWECKTFNRKSFDELEKKGVEACKPEHYLQMQVYMRLVQDVLRKLSDSPELVVDRARYWAVCKDDDRIHTERIELDRKAADAALEKAERIALSEHIPAPVSDTPGWWQCRNCMFDGFCHQIHRIGPEGVNCRTCAHCTPKPDGNWFCEKCQATVPEREWRAFPCHVLHPDLTDWTLVPGAGDEWTAVWESPQGRWRNGEGGLKTKDLLKGEEEIDV